MERLVPARCALMGYSLREMKVDGQYISPKFLRPELQERLGVDGYDEGTRILKDFFAQELEKFDTLELHPVGRKIIECFLKDGTVEDYCQILPLGLE